MDKTNNVVQDTIKEFCTVSSEDVLKKLQTRESGLTQEEVVKRQKKYGLNVIKKRRVNALLIFVRQLTGNPLIIVLAVATFISYFLNQHVSAYYIFFLIFMSIILGFWNEYSAEKTIENLLKKIASKTELIRSGKTYEALVTDITIGDIVTLSAGDIIPADIRLISCNNMEINESALTGESQTVYKTEKQLTTPPKTLKDFINVAFMGTAVETGSGKGVVIAIGKNTQYGKIAESVIFVKPETQFQKGLTSFGRLLVNIILIFTAIIFLINALLGHKLLDSLLFSLAIAVGLTPELLPIIVTISLSHGAGKLAKKKVIAKQLIAIENLGNMDILCTDKTGTLTEGEIHLINSINAQNKKDPKIVGLVLTNDTSEKKKEMGGIDGAIIQYATEQHIQTKTTREIIYQQPFDYEKKMSFFVAKENNTYKIVVKGASSYVLKRCKGNTKEIEKKIISLNTDGFRVSVVASKIISYKKSYSFDDTHELTCDGYLTFLDTPKKSAKIALKHLDLLHVGVKIITGDNELVTQRICEEVGLVSKGILSGEEIDQLSDEVLLKKANDATIFPNVNPSQKLRIIQSLRKSGNTIGYLGDGINDIPALHAADVGISVNTAIDVAKGAASVVLLEKSLDVILEGIKEGRKTFNNTIKYILMGTSSNFGNMFSASISSFLLPFLPMTPVQILLTNGLYDISQLSIPTDNVDHESLVRPKHWDINFIKNYMIFFGPISSVYDFLTFGVMIFLFHAHGALFQTGWFIESMATEILVVFVIRTSKTPFFLSRPSKWLLATCLAIVGISLLIPFSPLKIPLGFMTPPPLYFLILIILVSTYLLLVESLKKRFLKKYIL